MPGPAFGESTLAEIAAEVEAGRPVADAARARGLRPGTVWQRLRRGGLLRARKPAERSGRALVFSATCACGVELSVSAGSESEDQWSAWCAVAREHAEVAHHLRGRAIGLWVDALWQARGTRGWRPRPGVDPGPD